MTAPTRSARRSRSAAMPSSTEPAAGSSSAMARSSSRHDTRCVASSSTSAGERRSLAGCAASTGKRGAVVCARSEAIERLFMMQDTGERPTGVGPPLGSGWHARERLAADGVLARAIARCDPGAARCRPARSRRPPKAAGRAAPEPPPAALATRGQPRTAIESECNASAGVRNGHGLEVGGARGVTRTRDTRGGEGERRLEDATTGAEPLAERAA